MSATYAKLRSGEWGIKSTVPLRAGERSADGRGSHASPVASRGDVGHRLGSATLDGVSSACGEVPHERTTITMDLDWSDDESRTQDYEPLATPPGAKIGMVKLGPALVRAQLVGSVARGRVRIRVLEGEYRGQVKDVWQSLEVFS
jgi:hypothetical protein